TAFGFTAAVRDAAGKATVTRSFDPMAEETLFFPRDLPPKKWIGLRCFELHIDRADIADGRVTPSSIVEAFNVGKDITCCLLPCCILPVMDQLGFERVKEALHRGIVIAIALAAHRGPEASRLH